MTAGFPLTDADRQRWLARIAEWIDERLDREQNGIVTCLALKRAYRDAINRRGSGVVFVFLAGTKEILAARLALRHGHFMPSNLIDSQFADLEEPAPGEPAIRVDVGPAPALIADCIIEELGLNH
jgi:gluconokinase/shikimate kinase